MDLTNFDMIVFGECRELIYMQKISLASFTFTPMIMLITALMTSTVAILFGNGVFGVMNNIVGQLGMIVAAASSITAAIVLISQVVFGTMFIGKVFKSGNKCVRHIPVGYKAFAITQNVIIMLGIPGLIASWSIGLPFISFVAVHRLVKKVSSIRQESMGIKRELRLITNYMYHSLLQWLLLDYYGPELEWCISRLQTIRGGQQQATVLLTRKQLERLYTYMLVIKAFLQDEQWYNKVQAANLELMVDVMLQMDNHEFPKKAVYDLLYSVYISVLEEEENIQDAIGRTLYRLDKKAQGMVDLRIRNNLVHFLLSTVGMQPGDICEHLIAKLANKPINLKAYSYVVECIRSSGWKTTVDSMCVCNDAAYGAKLRDLLPAEYQKVYNARYAISHVWAQKTMFLAHHNNIYQQLTDAGLKLSELYCDVINGGEVGTLLDAYRQADVLIVDRFIMASIPGVKYNDYLIAITQWADRGWTAQEAGLGRSCNVFISYEGNRAEGGILDVHDWLGIPYFDDVAKHTGMCIPLNSAGTLAHARELTKRTWRYAEDACKLMNIPIMELKEATEMQNLQYSCVSADSRLAYNYSIGYGGYNGPVDGFCWLTGNMKEDVIIEHSDIQNIIGIDSKGVRVTAYLQKMCYDQSCCDMSISIHNPKEGGIVYKGMASHIAMILLQSKQEDVDCKALLLELIEEDTFHIIGVYVLAECYTSIWIDRQSDGGKHREITFPTSCTLNNIKQELTIGYRGGVH
jgi:hypothetical protein